MAPVVSGAEAMTPAERAAATGGSRGGDETAFSDMAPAERVLLGWKLTRVKCDQDQPWWQLTGPGWARFECGCCAPTEIDLGPGGRFLKPTVLDGRPEVLDDSD